MKYSRFLWSVHISTKLDVPLRKYFYSSSVQIMASISLLWISQFFSTGDRNLLWNATSLYLPSIIDCWDKTVSMAKFKLSTSIQKGSKSYSKTSTKVVVTAILRASKVAYFLSFYSHALLEYVRLKRGQVIVKKSYIKYLQKLTNPRKTWMSVHDFRINYSQTPVILIGFMEISFSNMTRPRYLICSF